MHLFARIGLGSHVCAVVMAVVCSGLAEAATDDWNGGAGVGSPYWDLPANWSAGIPGPTSDAALGAFNTEFRSLSGSLAIKSFTGTGTLSSYLEDIAPYLDADGNGEVDALTDGVLIFRYLLGLTGSALTQGAVGPGATRPDAGTIATHLGTLVP